MALGGKRPGSGRKPGKKLAKTLEREKVLDAMRQRIMRISDRLLDKQLVLANGQQFLYRIDKTWVKTGKGETSGYWRNEKPVLVEGEMEIRSYLEELSDEANGDIERNDDPSAAYYFITTKEPNNQALDSMLDRTFGKSTQSTKLVGDNDKSIPITSINVVPIIQEK